MPKKVLLIIDALNDFLEPDGVLYCGADGRNIIPYIRKLTQQIKDEKGTVIYLTDAHDENDKEFELFPKHSVKGTKGSEIIADLAVDRKNDIILEKTRFSGFYKTDLENVLAQLAPDEVHVTGVCTSICVLFTVIGLRDRDYSVIVHRQGVADFNDEAHRFSLNHMEKVFGIKVV